MAGGFMSGFGPAFGKSFDKGVDRYKEESQDIFKTRLKFGLDAKAEYDKQNAEDRKLEERAKAVAGNVPGIPEEAWKRAGELLRSGYSNEEVEDRLRRTSFTALETVEAPESDVTLPAASDSPIEAQTEEAMGMSTLEDKAPTEKPTEAPKEGGGIVDGIREIFEGDRDRRTAQADEKVRDTLGMSEDEYSAMLDGYKPTDLTMEGYTFTVAETGGLKDPTNFAQANYQLAISDPRYVEAEKNGDTVGMRRVLKEYEDSGKASAVKYDWKGTQASLNDIMDDATRDLQSDDPATVSAARTFLDVTAPSMQSQLKSQDDSKGSTATAEENFERVSREIAEIDRKIRTASGEELSALTAKREELAAEQRVEQGILRAKEIIGSDTTTVDVIVRDEQAGRNRAIKATKYPDSTAPNGFRLIDQAGQSLSILRVADENDQTVIASFKSLSDEIAKFNTETVTKAPGTMLVAKRMTDNLRDPNMGAALINATGGLANVWEATVQNIGVLGRQVGIVYDNEVDANGRPVARVSAQDFANQYGYDSIEQMAIARDDFNANSSALVYLVAESMFGQSGRGLSDTDLIKAREAIGVDLFNDPVALANFIDEKMVDMMDNINMKGRSLTSLGPIKAYQQLIGTDEVPLEAQTFTVQDVASQNPGTAAAQAVQYYNSIAEDVRSRAVVKKEVKPDPAQVKKLSQTVVDGITAKSPELGAKLQAMLDGGATGYKVVNGRFVAVQ